MSFCTSSGLSSLGSLSTGARLVQFRPRAQSTVADGLQYLRPYWTLPQYVVPLVATWTAAPIPSPPIGWLNTVGVPALVRKRVPLSCSPPNSTNGLFVTGSPDATA